MTQNGSDWQAAAKANLQAARQRNGHSRLGRTKSRKGCVTCKQRRVKCDETQPECNRCRSSGRQCSGYLSPNSSKSPSPGSPVDSLILASTGLPNDERRQLDFFISHAGPHLAGIFDRDFWCGSILRVAQSEPFVMDSLLAISTLYEHPQYLPSFRNKQEMRENAFQLVKHSRGPVHGELAGPMKIDANHARALKLYNRAIRTFKQRMNDGEATPVLALVSCILFICIETIRDHIYQAMELFEKGIGLLNNPMTNTNEADMVTLVRRMFMRLGVLATTFGHPSAALQKIEPQTQLIRPSFQSVAETRTELFTLLAESNKFSIDSNVWREALLETKEWKEDRVGKGPGDPEALRRKAEIDALYSKLEACQAQHWQKLERWRRDFELLYQSIDQTEAGAASYLLMLYHTWRIWLPTRLGHRKMDFDNHFDDFREVIHHAEIFIMQTSNDQPTFTFDMGAVPILFHAAMECRIPSLRRRALWLLKKAPKKESILGADSSAEVAYHMICFEERGSGLPDPDEYDGDVGPVGIDDSFLPPPERRVLRMEVLKEGLEFQLRITSQTMVDGYCVWHDEFMPMG